MYFRFQFLVEDQSGAVFIETIMDKIVSNYPGVEYDCKSFGGSGNFPKGNTAKEIKTGKLLNDLAIYLRGFNRCLQYVPAVLVIVIDNDTRETANFYMELQDIAKRNQITLDHVFCIAVEEIEAWLLGDEEAIVAAYPNAKLRILHKYQQDSICGTWEVLADVVYPGGHAKLKQHTGYAEIGKCKSEWAQNIGAHMSLECNKSPSFQHFLSEINRRLPTVS